MRKFLTFLLLSTILLGVVSCGKDNDDNKEDNNMSYNKIDEYFKEIIFDTIEDDYEYEGTPTKGPFTVYNEDGSIVEENKYMSYAIRKAGEVASSSNKAYVKDANGLMIYQRESKTKYYCFDGSNYVGVKSRNDAVSWSAKRSKSYIIDGFASGYQGLGTIYYEGTNFSDPINLELYSGGYNYMYTKRGFHQGGEFVENGFGYIECRVNLSDAIYKPTEDPDRWNAYIFLHGNSNDCADFGLKGVVENGEMVWKLFRLCSHESHKEDGKKWYEDVAENAVTKMKYNEDKGYYEGQDDLFMQLWQGKDGWKLNITNLTTNEKHELSEYHTDMMKGQDGYFQLLLAASYCPAVSNIWNSRCGAFLRNVCYTDIKVARYNSNETYDLSSLQEFYPDSNMGYGFSQAADCASMIYGVNHEGEKMISYSCYYDGGGHFE